MSLEQKLERSEALLEVNEQNRQKAEKARHTAQRARNQVRVSNARVRNCQAQLQQAIAARNAAAQSSAKDSSGSAASHDAAVSDAQAALSAANMELQAARREQIRAEEQLEQAEAVHRESAEKLSGEMEALQEVSRKYGLEMGKTRQLMNAPEGHLASPLLEQLGAGREKVNDLRRRIAASLGISFSEEGGAGELGGTADRGLSDSARILLARAGILGSGSLLSPTRGFQTISGSHTIEDDLKHTNPNYSPDDPDSLWNINCQRCVSAYEARRRGYDVEALPAGGVSDVLPIMNHPRGWPSVYEGAEPVDCSAATGEYAKAVVEQQLIAWGDNCRAIVRVRWLPEYGGGGHVFIAERVNGVTRFVDPQNGDSDAGDYFSLAQGPELYCMRIDDRAFTGRIRDCCKNRGGST